MPPKEDWATDIANTHEKNGEVRTSGSRDAWGQTDRHSMLIAILRSRSWRVKSNKCLLIAKFNYTDPTGPARTLSATRTDFFAAKLRWVRAGRRQSPCGSGRVRVMEFSFNSVNEMLSSNRRQRSFKLNITHTSLNIWTLTSFIMHFRVENLRRTS